MERWSGKIAVVTGASAGIGASICVQLARAGLTVIGLARRIEMVEALQSQLADGTTGTLAARRCDVSKRDEVNAVFEAIQEEFGSINILVNNAGCLTHTMILADGNDAELQQTLDTNVSGVVHCTKAAYRQLSASGDYGHIVNINSILGHKIVRMGDKQMMNLYPGTKHLISATTEILRQELVSLNNMKVRISSISPGLVETEIFAAAGLPNVDQMYTALPALSADDVAETVLYVLSVPENVQIHELIVKPVGELW